jgi:hypothetical protein
MSCYLQRIDEIKIFPDISLLNVKCILIISINLKMLFGVPHSKGGSIIASHSNLNVTGTRQLQSPTR